MTQKFASDGNPYESLFAQNPDAVFFLNSQGYFSKANQAALTLMECDEDKLIANHFTHFCLPDDVSKMQDIFRTSVEGKAVSLNVQALSMQKSLLDLNVTVMPLVIKGRGSGVCVIAKNTSEQVRARRESDIIGSLNQIFNGDQSLYNCLDKVLRLFCSFNGAVISEAWVTNIDSSELHLAASVSSPDSSTDSCTSWKSPDGIIGLTEARMEKVVLDDYLEHPNCLRKQLAKDNKLKSAVGIPVIFKGKVIAVLAFFYRLNEKSRHTFDFSENLLGLLASVIHRKKSDNEFSQYFTLSPDMLSIIGFDGYFKKVNPTFSHVLGFTREELLAKPWIDFVHPDDREQTLRHGDGSSDIRGLFPFENRYITKDGRSVWMAWNISVATKEQLVYAVARDVTDRKILEKTVEIEQARFAQMFVEAPVSMCILKGPTHIFVKANSLYNKLTGGKDIIGKPVNEVFPEIMSQGFLDRLDNVYKTGETFSTFESPVSLDIHGTGELHLYYLSFMYQAYRNNAGEIEGVFYFGTDVTEQVHARNRIVESEKKQNDLIQNLPVAMYTTNKDGQITLYNKAAASLWGFHSGATYKEPTEHFELFYTNFMPIPEGESPMGLTLKTGIPVRDREIILKRYDGEVRHVMPYPSPIFNSKGKLVGGMNIVIDITEKKQAEAELLKLSLIAKKTTNAVIITDLQDRIEWVNDAFSHITQYSSGEVIGKTADLLHGTATNTQIISFINDPCNRNKSLEFELLKYTKSGKPFWVEIKRQPLSDPENKITHFFYIESDITERKEAYDKLLNSESEIRRFARQQNNIIEEERARMAREIHDEFGQQLAGLKMSLGALKKDLLTDLNSSENLLKLIISDVDRCTENLRELATELRPGILDTLGLFPSIDWLVKDFKKKSGIKSLASFNVDENLKVDDELAICFFRICQEALTNVAKHSGASIVHVEMEQIGDILSMKVIDNGRGIFEDYINDPFSMGMLGMRERASLVGGELHVSSNPGKTSIIFTVNTRNDY